MRTALDRERDGNDDIGQAALGALVMQVALEAQRAPMARRPVADRAESGTTGPGTTGPGTTGPGTTGPGTTGPGTTGPGTGGTRRAQQRLPRPHQGTQLRPAGWLC